MSIPLSPVADPRDWIDEFFMRHTPSITDQIEAAAESHDPECWEDGEYVGAWRQCACGLVFNEEPFYDYVRHLKTELRKEGH